jgi:hypothetical protein
MSYNEEEITKSSGVLNAQNTMVGALTQNPDGTIKEDFAAKDDNGILDTSKYSTAPNTSTDTSKSNTGSGLDTATDLFDYKWNTQAEDRAQYDYKDAVLKSKANYLTNRNTIEQQGVTYQNELDMQKYSQNQSNEKAGWTGGYVLDTERQMAFLKQTIQSQMYGQMELQRYGYDTSLAAARLAYDTNKYDLAMQYYQKAIENSLGEAQLTGYYVSPEVKEHLNQYAIASKNLNDGTGTERDEQIVDAVYKWFESNGISKQGVITMAREDYINTLKMTAQTLANFQKDSSLLKIDIDSFGEVDAEGNLQYSDGYGTVKTVNFNQMETDKILEYAGRGELAKQQVMGYFDGLIEKDLNSYLDSVKTGTGDDIKYNITKEGLEKYIKENCGAYINKLIQDESGILKDYTKTVEKNGVKVQINSSDTGAEIKIEAPKAEAKADRQAGNGYTYSSMDDLYNQFSADYPHLHIGDKDMFNILEDKSKWGNKIKQRDFNSGESSGEAGKYIDKIIQDVKDKKIPVGSVVLFNYGEAPFTDDIHTYAYCGNGIFVQVYGDKEAGFWVKDSESKKIDSNLQYLYIPDGYKRDKGSHVKKK